MVHFGPLGFFNCQRRLGRSITLALMLVSGAVSTGWCAESKDWQTLLNKARELAGAGETAAAEEAFNAAAQAVNDQQEGPVPKATVLGRIGEFYLRQERYEQAEETLKTAAGIAESEPSYPAAGLAQIHQTLGALYLELRKGKKAEDQFETAIRLLQEEVGKKHTDLLDALLGLGVARQQQNNLRQAELTYRRALSILADGEPDKDLSRELPFQAATRMYWAEYLSYGKVDTTSTWWRKVVLLDRLAGLHADFGGGSEGIAFAEAAVKARRSMLGTRSLGVARGDGNLAAVLRRAGEFERAKQVLLEALEITKEHKYLGSFPAAWILDSLMEVSKELGDAAEVEHWARELIASVAPVYGTGHPIYVFTLGRVLKSMEGLDLAAAQAEFTRLQDEAREAARASPAYLLDEDGIVPPTLKKRVPPTYPQESVRLKYEEQVILFVDIDQAGKPTKITLHKSAGHGLDGNAASAVKKWRFQPATLNGQPVSTSATIRVSFRMRTR